MKTRRMIVTILISAAVFFSGVRLSQALPPAAFDSAQSKQITGMVSKAGKEKACPPQVPECKNHRKQAVKPIGFKKAKDGSIVIYSPCDRRI